MKTKFFLAVGLLVTAMGVSQNTTLNMQGNTADLDENVFLGQDAGASNTLGLENVFSGFKAGYSNTEGSYTIAIGNKAGYSFNPIVTLEEPNNTGGAIFIGNNAGYYNTKGYNVFVGYQSGYNNTASANVFMGTSTGTNNNGSANSFFGHGTGESSTGSSNVFLGSWAGKNSVGSNNVLLGNDTGAGNGDPVVTNLGSNNVIVGYRAGRRSTGNSNVFMGYMSGHNAIGNKNILIGYQAGKDETGSNKLYIADSDTDNPLIYGDFSANELKFNAQKVGVGFESGAFGDFPDTTSLITDVDYRFFVKGGVLAEEVRVRLQGDWSWPDYVFANDYELMPLSEVEGYIANNGHLPNMPSAEEVEEDGIALGNMVKLQQEKIEELTLHLIEQEKEMEALKAQVQLLLNKQ
ncbi:MAG: hypothetical protein BM557_08455 [Flavobacterium sp. MedPE-SWcel]|uniref:hypothetical protein n=1 Tax=uncultured Flavobacterium sp. TaxID=165435 RepID=UPI00091753FF|nr:hypothetical protein [uncultured Flavobacterium sp.]OIQ17234.1 MAG: hypothetical protein BM557_08455 [Flavobacterium sp. MedPE-SWcel]